MTKIYKRLFKENLLKEELFPASLDHIEDRHITGFLDNVDAGNWDADEEELIRFVDFMRSRGLNRVNFQDVRKAADAYIKEANHYYVTDLINEFTTYLEMW